MTIHPRAVAVAGVVLALAAGVAACGSDDGGGKASQGAASTHKHLTIAFLMPCSTCADRFEMQDKPCSRRRSGGWLRAPR